MTKRTIEVVASEHSLSSLSLSTSVKATRTSCKRQRTEKFLGEINKHQSIMQTCRFFQEELERLSFEDSRGPLTSEMKGNVSLSAMQENLRQHTEKYETNFHSHCQDLKKVADDKVRLSATYQCMSQAIDTQGRGTNGTLSLLNQGLETTLSIKESIARYAGVPSHSDVDDFKALQGLLTLR